jgi:hypothetical protein
MLTTVVPRIAVKQVILGAAGKLSTGTITPATPATGPKIPDRIVAADVTNAASWTFTDVAGGVGFPVAAGEVRHLPGSFVKDTIFAAGTYLICFYLDT